MSILCWITTGLIVSALVSLLSYIVPFVLDAYYFKEQDLKAKYGAEWALVTGSSSGIGRALTSRLARQGINVVMVAIDDKLLTDVHAQMQKDYPSVQFRKIGVNLGKAGYMDAIVAGTRDILPTLVFNNAGYVSTGLFSDSQLDSLLANYECNATAPIHISHHFVARILAESKRSVVQRRGAVFFTSSPAGVMPCPTTVMYGATKAFLTEFATSLSAELFADGIDTLVVHPSPVDTGFYSGNKHDMSAMKLFQRTATSPDTIAACFFKSAGRSVVCDQGYFSIALRMLLKFVDYNLIALLITRTSTMSGDYVKLVGQRKKKE